MKTEVKEKSLQVLRNELDSIFSEFIRLRDADVRGTITCFVTGERVYWRDSDAAHYIYRSAMPTRYDEMNVHACTVDTNRFENPYEHQKKYKEKMIIKYGVDAVHELAKKSMSLQKFMRSDLIEMILDYTEKVKLLRKEKGL